MTGTLVECVPNFSEGRSQALLDDLVRSLKGARVLDASRDVDHNRSVITYVAPVDGAVDAAMAVLEVATRCIDMSTHEGVHPRIGATDVFPFVPVGGASMAQCVELAHLLGRRAAEELGLPVYFYGDAARSASRRQLPNVRRGGLGALRDRVASGEADALPDVGTPAAHPTAGFCAIGARPCLVAFNVNLESNDLDAARAIAGSIRAMRAAGGGLPGIRALGLRLEQAGVVQVSVNVCDPRATGLVRVFDEIAALAEARSITVRDSELIGLAPAFALDERIAAHTKLRGFDPARQIIERLIDGDV